VAGNDGLGVFHRRVCVYDVQYKRIGPERVEMVLNLMGSASEPVRMVAHVPDVRATGEERGNTLAALSCGWPGPSLGESLTAGSATPS